MIPRTVTIDTNALPIDDLRLRATALGVDLAISTVTDRELGDNDPRTSSTARVAEAFVLNESRLGEAVLVDTARGLRLEEILSVISHGSFPGPATRSTLAPGQRRQLRDAMAIDAHIASGREAFVTNDHKAFIKNDLWNVLKRRFGVHILTREEFSELITPGS